jgi:hypothetical protein
MANIWEACCEFGMIPAAIDVINDLRSFFKEYLNQKGKSIN